MNNFRVRVQNLVVAVSTISFCIACQPLIVDEEKFPDLACQVPPLASATQVDNSSPLRVSVNVDGSGSMYGYVKNNANTRYINTLKLLDTVLHVGKQSRSQVSTEYYRVGETKIQPITPNQYQQARTGDFYTGKNPDFPPVNSKLDVAIVKPQAEDQLLILITDLDQEGRDQNKLNKAIQQTYLKQSQPGQAIAVLGIKSEFNHTVYSIDKDVYPDFLYKTLGKDPEDFRPFYVLFMGSYQDIMHYYDKMQRKNPDLINASKFSVFYPDSIEQQTATLKNLPNQLPQDIRRPNSLKSGSVVVEVASPPYEILEIHPRIDATTNPSISYSANFNTLEHTPKIDVQSISTETKVLAYDPNSEKFTPSNNNSLKSIINTSDWDITNNQLKFTNTLNLKSIPSSGIYLVKINALAKKLSDEPWWLEWDRQSKVSDTDGSKTYNLLNFMQNLKLTTTDLIEEPAIGHFCYAIQKN